MSVSKSGRVNRVMMTLEAMTVEEREELFGLVGDTYCVGCGVELPDADSNEPDHECPNAEEDEEDEEDEEEDDEDEEVDTASEE